ncbi:hypothetical protein [Rhodoferax sp. WC2427]|uniref:hypothetical protein n=1 Tax=Rhodoferax sp. WC2427 TaxID=3234144 RepID=UPI003465F735
MLFKVTHIDRAGHRHQARVSALSVGDAIDQVERLWGVPRSLACVRMPARPVLQLVARGHHHFQITGRTLCA